MEWGRGWDGVGLAARMSVLLLREYEEEKRIVEEDSEFERFMAFGVGPLDALDDQQEVLLPPPPRVTPSPAWTGGEEGNEVTWGLRLARARACV